MSAPRYEIRCDVPLKAYSIVMIDNGCPMVVQAGIRSYERAVNCRQRWERREARAALAKASP